MAEKIAMGWVTKVVEMLLRTDAVKATKYVSPILVIRAVRTRVGKRIDKRSNIQITLTIGRPNYLERDFIKDCKKAGEPFPVRNIQLKEYNPPIKKLSPKKKKR